MVSGAVIGGGAQVVNEALSAHIEEQPVRFSVERTARASVGGALIVGYYAALSASAARVGAKGEYSRFERQLNSQLRKASRLAKRTPHEGVMVIEEGAGNRVLSSRTATTARGKAVRP